MSDSSKNPSTHGVNRNATLNLPSWMSSRQNATKPNGKKPVDVSSDEKCVEGETPKSAKGRGKAHTDKTSPKGNAESGKPSVSTVGGTNFSKLLEGVVFVLSGFVNPERSILRSQALEMGADFQVDWNSNCTLLVCAFPNTPKFRQVEAECGTIVSKEWISECYNQEKLVEIESYLIHAGKSWRRQSVSDEARQDQEPSASKKPQKQVERASNSKSTTTLSKKQNVASTPAKDCFPPTEVKKWAIDDLHKTISWLESQDEKPEPSEIKKIATEGILTCLEDAIDSLKQEQGVQQITEQWGFIPKAVEELAKLEGSGDASGSTTKKDLYKKAMAYKEIYKEELSNFDDSSLVKNKRRKTDEIEREGNHKNEVPAGDLAGYDSDETIEMTEQDIDQAYNKIVLSCRSGK